MPNGCSVPRPRAIGTMQSGPEALARGAAVRAVGPLDRTIPMAEQIHHPTNDDVPRGLPQLPRPEVDLSVVLCTWQGERWIRVLLESIAAQERLPDELVVQDDASNDATVELIRAFAADAPFDVRLEVNRRRVGSTANFALALTRCRGRYLALADQDDVWYPSKLQCLAEELDDDPTITVAFSDADLIGEDGHRLGRRLWDTRQVGRTLRRHPVVPEELFARRALTTGCTMLMRRRVLEAALPFPQELDHPAAPMRHDRWLSLVAAAVGTVRAYPEPLLGFRLHEAQETGVLVGPALVGALHRSAVEIAADADVDHGSSLLGRAAQLEAAARRADLLGDFIEADALRRVADGNRARARIGVHGDGLGDIRRAARYGAYPRSLPGMGSMAADVVRVLRPNRGSRRATT